MTAPGAPTSLTLEEIEAQEAAATAAGQKPDLTKIVLEGDVPEHLKGKSVKELLDYANGLGTSLKTSEEARRAAEARAAAVPAAPAAAAAPVVEEPKELTDEEFAELFRTDPLTAVKKMNEQATRRVEKNLDLRIGTLVKGGASSAEQAARAKYPEEFTLFGDEITKMVANLPNKDPLSRPEAWDDMISYIRGKPGNFDKLFEHRNSKGREAAAAAAQQEQEAQSGVTMTSMTVAPAGGKPNKNSLDDTEKEIARNLGMTEADYIKWRNV